jgi:uncharacterized protein (TIGR01244 family)
MSLCKQLEDNFFVSGQVSRDSLEHAVALGVSRLINNRPDGEEAGQPSNEEVSAWADELGLEYYFVPVVPGTLTAEVLEQFTEAVKCDEGRVMASCRTGTRSCVLWALERASRRAIPVDDLITAAGQAGYDIAAMKPSLEQLANLAA